MFPRTQDMLNRMLDVNGDHESIVGALTQYLSVLEKGDQYLTVKVPQFWRSGNLGINGRYLTTNSSLQIVAFINFHPKCVAGHTKS